MCAGRSDAARFFYVFAIPFPSIILAWVTVTPESYCFKVMPSAYTDKKAK
jgi:hypothetical protein